MYFHDILILELMVEADLLAGELGALPPYSRVAEGVFEVAVNVWEDVFHRDWLGEDEWFFHVGFLADFFQVDADKPELLVDEVFKRFNILARLRADEQVDRECLLECVSLLPAEEVALVHDDESSRIHPIPMDGVDEIINAYFLADDDGCIRELILAEDAFYRLTGNREGYCRVDADPALAFLLDRNIRFFCEAESCRVRFAFKDGELFFRVGGCEDEEDKLCLAEDAEDFSPAADAEACALEDAGEVEELDLGFPMVEDAWDDGGRGECIRALLAFSTGEDAEEAALPHARQAEEGYRGMPALLDGEATTPTTLLRLALFKPFAEACELGFDEADMMLCPLIILGRAEFFLKLADLFVNTRHRREGDLHVCFLKVMLGVWAGLNALLKHFG